jgi:CubicO group peptidase (beta-lactamase class C family)
MNSIFRRRIIFLLTITLLFFEASLAQNGVVRTDRQIATEIEEYMRSAIEFERFTGSILVARNGKPIISKGYGLANVEHDIPNTPKTVFRLASLTKQFTATSIMMLQERGKLNINDPFCKYLPDCPMAWQPITIKQLMTMTHGIPGVSSLDLGAIRGLPVPWDQWLEATGKKPLEYKPGTEFRYLGSGYTLLGFLIERISGKSYGEFLEENIFDPLGMKNSGHEDPSRILKNRATGYRQMPGEPITNLPYREIVRMYASGGIYSTTEDMLLWDQALYTDKLLSKRSIEEMYVPDKEMLPGKSYASGVWISTKHGRREIAHGGNATGFITYIARYPSDKVTIIVLSNNEKGSSGKIAGVLSSIVFGSPYEKPYERKAITLTPSGLEKYVGEYKFDQPNTTIIITRENGRLFQKRNTEQKFEMFAESETKFFLKAEDIQHRFIKDSNGLITGMIVEQGDGTIYESITGRKIK